MADKLNILKEKISAKLRSQIPSILDEIFEEMQKEGNITDDELADILQTQLEIKPKAKKPEKPKTKGSDGFAKLPHDKIELPDWIKSLLGKRSNTLAGIADEDKIFNIVTQRFIKRSSCISKKNCSLEEVVYNGHIIGFTEGGNPLKLADAPEFQKFLTLFHSENSEKKESEKKESEKKEKKETKKEEDFENNLLFFLKEKTSATLSELKKHFPTKRLVTTLDDLKDKGLIEQDDKTYKFISSNDSIKDDESIKEDDVYEVDTEEDD